MSTAHLTLMPKPRLIERLERAENEARYWRNQYAIRAAAPDLADAHLSSLCVEPDPEWADHRAVLERELAAFDQYPTKVAEQPVKVARCQFPDCARPLDDQGRCRRHEARAIRAEREAS